MFWLIQTNPKPYLNNNCFMFVAHVVRPAQSKFKGLILIWRSLSADYCPPQTYRRDETRRVSTMRFSSAGVRGPVFASFW